jgi:hypothetical protein
MFLRTLLASFVLVVSAAALQAAQNPASDTTTIVHVTVIDVATGKEIPDQAVVLQGDHIVSVAASDSSVPPQGASSMLAALALFPASGTCTFTSRTSRICRFTLPTASPACA